MLMIEIVLIRIEHVTDMINVTVRNGIEHLIIWRLYETLVAQEETKMNKKQINE